MQTRWDGLLERNTRVWMGGGVRAWLGLVRRHGVRFAPGRVHLAGLVTLFAPFNSIAGWLGDRIFVRRERSPEPTPVFILGHWRSGTTLLHEMLSLDARFAFPTSWECFAPHLSLWLSEEAAGRLPLRIPSSRPFDKVQIDWQSPQEDEFALCGMGTPSPYEWFAFPRSLAPDRAPDRFAAIGRETRVAPALKRFLRRLRSRRARGLCSSQRGERPFVVLKSPTHTFRLDELRREFPTARFIRIRRDPYVVFSSTRRLWKKLSDHQGLQSVDFDVEPFRTALDEHVLRTYAAMQRTLEHDHAAWAASDPEIERRYVDLSYDEIDPTRPENTPETIVERVARVYRRLGLDAESGSMPAQAADALERFARTKSSYEKNEFAPLSDRERAMIEERWSELSTHAAIEVDR